MMYAMKILILPMLITLGTLAFVFPTSAQEKEKTESVNVPEKKNSNSGKRTTINFEDQLVEGSQQKPELFYLLQKRQFNFKRLIRLREDFLPEMRKTAEEIQSKGSGQ